MRERSIVLLSGGLDSAANLAFCRLQDEPVLALTVDYGQRAAENEIASARRLAAHFSVPHRILELKWLGALGGSSLTDRNAEVPTIQTSELDDAVITRETAKSVWVPNRNGVLIHAAAAFAERHQASRVVVGFNIEEAATFPDNSLEYLRKETEALALSTSNQVRIHSYTVELNKREIVRELRAKAPNFPFDALWSCYHPSSGAPCGRCESCRRLNRALGAEGTLS